MFLKTLAVAALAAALSAASTPAAAHPPIIDTCVCPTYEPDYDDPPVDPADTCVRGDYWPVLGDTCDLRIPGPDPDPIIAPYPPVDEVGPITDVVNHDDDLVN